MLLKLAIYIKFGWKYCNDVVVVIKVEIDCHINKFIIKLIKIDQLTWNFSLDLKDNFTYGISKFYYWSVGA